MSGRLRTCARSIYQALFPPPPKSLGTRLLHLYSHFATVVTTANKLVAEPRQACMNPCRAQMLCNYNVHVHVHVHVFVGSY